MRHDLSPEEYVSRIRDSNVKRMLETFDLTKRDFLEWLAENDIKRELSDESIERIQTEAEEAALHAVKMSQVVNPYDHDSPEGEVWSSAFRSAFARNNGY